MGHEVLIRWKDLPMYEATWESFTDFDLRFPGFHLEDKVRVWEGSLNLCMYEAKKGYPSDSASYNDPNIISQRLPIVFHKTQKLKLPA
ncbi:unnamed protein product [Lactuca virosa]|uniref:Chromo domain-containing protein n=1 Tax=Lactuca virosa TaxID=75947 RepID=A0AAU9NRF8_9ASTR|nr:unnamed protein product [Lactuca virosa]